MPRSPVAIASPLQRVVVAVAPRLVDPPAFIMTRAMLLGLKRRAEGLAPE